MTAEEAARAMREAAAKAVLAHTFDKRDMQLINGGKNAFHLVQPTIARKEIAASIRALPLPSGVEDDGGDIRQMSAQEIYDALGIVPREPSEKMRAVMKAFADNQALRPIAKDDGWRPIETAPTNEAVLVYGGEVRYPVVASWTGLSDEPWALDYLGTVGQEIDPPTHWHPLPALPKEDGT